MSNTLDKGRRSSRRDFAKSMAAGLAASQIGTTLAKAAPSEPNEKLTLGQKKSDLRRTHDTPPPIVFENGSFVLERAGEFQAGDIGMNAANTRKEYRVRPEPGTATIVPAHIKVVEGSGEMLYRNDHAADCIVSIELEGTSGPAIVNAQTSPNKTRFVIDVDSSKFLNVGNHNNNDKPTSKKRDRRYRHSGAGLSMKEITVKNNTGILFRVLPKDLPQDGADLRVMIWLEPE